MIVPRLLLDANLSPSLITRLADIFTDTAHVHDLLPPGTPDEDVYEFASRNGFTAVVTCDQDFDALALLYGDPRVVRFRRGDLPTSAIERLIRRHLVEIMQLHDPAPPRALLLIPL